VQEVDVDIGMLWFDADPRVDVGAKIAKAASYYRTKYGRTPTLCLLHPATAGDVCPNRVGALEVRTSRSVLIHHFWLGVGQAEGGLAARQAA
jgi:hypothetical protein